MRIATLSLGLLMLAVPVSANIKGEVTDTKGKAVKTAVVSVVDVDGNVVTSAAVDTKGKFDLTAPAGE